MVWWRVWDVLVVCDDLVVSDDLVLCVGLLVNWDLIITEHWAVPFSKVCPSLTRPFLKGMVNIIK
jgi:hypothetical protein